MTSHLKVAAGKDGPYLSLESEVWKPIHQKLIASGVQRSWTLTGVLNAGTDDPYNYVTIREFDSLDQYYGGGLSEGAQRFLHTADWHVGKLTRGCRKPGGG